MGSLGNLESWHHEDMYKSFIQRSDDDIGGYVESL